MVKYGQLGIEQRPTLTPPRVARQLIGSHSEGLSILRPSHRSVVGLPPLLYVHGFAGNARTNLSDPASRTLRAIAGLGIPVILADYGGGTTWAIGAQSAITAAVTAANTRLGTRTDVVGVAGESMGSWAAAIWASDNPQVAACLWLVAPIVNAVNFYDDNPIFQGAIDTAYGGHPAFLAALPDYDPSHTNQVNTLRAMGVQGRIRCDAAVEDDLIRVADVMTWSGQVGGEAHLWPNAEHGDLYTSVPPDDIAQWIASRLLGSWYL